MKRHKGSVTLSAAVCAGLLTPAAHGAEVFWSENTTDAVFAATLPDGSGQRVVRDLDSSVFGEQNYTIAGLDLYNGFGSVDLIADVSGYLLPGGVTTPHIEYGAIELTAYSGSGNDLANVGAFGCRNLGTYGQLFVDVPLEHGSAVQSVTFRYYDTDGYNMNLELIEINDGTAGPTVSNTLSENKAASTGTAGYGEVTIKPVGGDKVSGDVRYVIMAHLLGKQSAEKELSFCGATVEYAREVS